MNQHELIGVLSANREMPSWDEAMTFHRALARLAEDRDVRLLQDLYLLFDDRCHYPEVMMGLVHLVESYDLDDQLATLLDVVPQLQAQAPAWTESLHYRIVNSETARARYKAHLAAAPAASREVERGILLQIEAKEQYMPQSRYAREVLDSM